MSKVVCSSLASSALKEVTKMKELLMELIDSFFELKQLKFKIKKAKIDLRCAELRLKEAEILHGMREKSNH